MTSYLTAPRREAESVDTGGREGGRKGGRGGEGEGKVGEGKCICGCSSTYLTKEEKEEEEGRKNDLAS